MKLQARLEINDGDLASLQAREKISERTSAQSSNDIATSLKPGQRIAETEG